MFGVVLDLLDSEDGVGQFYVPMVVLVAVCKDVESVARDAVTYFISALVFLWYAEFTMRLEPIRRVNVVNLLNMVMIHHQGVLYIVARVQRHFITDVCSVGCDVGRSGRPHIARQAVDIKLDLINL